VRLHFAENYWSECGRATAAAHAGGRIVLSFADATNHAVVNGIEVSPGRTP